MRKPRKTVQRKRKAQNRWLRLYRRYFTPIAGADEDDTASLVQPSPLRDVPSNATDGVMWPTPSR
jgi:hypothetical protein